MDREKVIAEKVHTLVGMCKGNGFGWFMTANDIGNEILSLLKEQDDMGKELTDAMELIRKKNEQIEKLLKKQEHKDNMFYALEDDWKRLKELLKEQEEQKQKWLQNIADNQLAFAPSERDNAYCYIKHQGIYDGLQMAYDILTEGR